MVRYPDHPVLNSLGIPIRSNREWREIAQAAEARADAAEREAATLRAELSHLMNELEVQRHHSDHAK